MSKRVLNNVVKGKFVINPVVEARDLRRRRKSAV
jgi:hypothetical protein